jgi:hypothetical protein
MTSLAGESVNAGYLPSTICDHRVERANSLRFDSNQPQRPIHLEHRKAPINRLTGFHSNPTSSQPSRRHRGVQACRKLLSQTTSLPVGQDGKELVLEFDHQVCDTSPQSSRTGKRIPLDSVWGGDPYGSGHTGIIAKYRRHRESISGGQRFIAAQIGQAARNRQR